MTLAEHAPTLGQDLMALRNVLLFGIFGVAPAVRWIRRKRAGRK